MSVKNLLVEIGTEELPPKSLRALAEAFNANLAAELDKAELQYEHIEWFAAPRRLALKVTALADAQPDKRVEKRGPAVSAAFDADGNPTKAAQGWARANGISVEQADRLKTDKGEWLLHVAEVIGKPTVELIPALVNTALQKLPIPKPMRWADKSTQFIRPVHTITMLYGADVVAGEVLGLPAGREVQGHRFMAAPRIVIADADSYLTTLEREGKVIADFETRKARILADAQQAAADIGGIADISDELLDEVSALVEWPVVLTATFEERFLAVPSEALVYTMKGDQKYFPVYDDKGQLLPHFIFVSNIVSNDPQQIISGNEKVVRPRLADAEFFFNTDRKRPLIDRLPELDSVLFQKQLGTLRDKTNRIAELASFIADAIGVDTTKATRAAQLSKCDLMTNMVFEFTDIQGVMGMHYARHDGEDEEVAVALNEQYQPRFAGDDLPSSGVAQSLALADKLDSLVGIFGIGQPPKGDKDPFALRRAAIGALRIIVEKNLPLDLEVLVAKAIDLFGDKLTAENVQQDVVDFMLGRFRAWYQDEGIDVDVIQAVLARRPTQPADFDKRVRAVSHFRTLDAAASLAAANKRVGNLLSKADGIALPNASLSLCQEAAETALLEQVEALEQKLAPLFAEGEYQHALSELAALREPVDGFFDSVMVMANDEALKLNRLAMLAKLNNLFLKVADISLLKS